MIARRDLSAWLFTLLTGLGIAVTACESPSTAADPATTPTPSATLPGEQSPDPTPSTGHVQPIIRF